MHIIINRLTREVFATESVKPPAEAYNADLFEVREMDYEPALGSIIPELSLEEYRTSVLERMEFRRGEARLVLEKLIYFQDMALVGKYIDCMLAMSDPAPTPEKYPVAFGLEARVRGMTPQEMADFDPAAGISFEKIAGFTIATPLTPQQMILLVLTTGTMWRAFSDRIEAVAYVARLALVAAESIEEIDLIMANISWPTLPS